jgi:aspartate racemase
MKTIGLVGGIGPESTIDYYRRLLARAPELGATEVPSILINSIDHRQMMAVIGSGDRAALTDALVRDVEVLARAGAGLGLIAANTPHIVFAAVQARTSIPLVSIVEATRDAAAALGLKKLGLLGTRLTMVDRFFPDVFEPRGIAVVAPDAADVEYVNDKYMRELVPGQFLDTTRAGLVQVMERLRTRAGIDGVILGGTELPLILRGVDYPLPLLDTTRIHVDAVLRAAIGEC